VTIHSPDFLAAGSEFPLAECLVAQLPAVADVVILPLAAVFTGATEAAVAVAELLGGTDFRVEALLVTNKESANNEHFAQRIREADAVIVTDGSPLHLRSTLRETAVERALRDASLVVGMGSVATVFGDPMIDPRGGAPTTGMGLFTDAIVTIEGPTLERTRELLTDDVELYVVERKMGIYRHSGEWYVSSAQ
jgi:cyanophycinase-like exopeptidase